MSAERTLRDPRLGSTTASRLAAAHSPKQCVFSSFEVPPPKRHDRLRGSDGWRVRLAVLFAGTPEGGTKNGRGNAKVPRKLRHAESPRPLPRPAAFSYNGLTMKMLRRARRPNRLCP